MRQKGTILSTGIPGLVAGNLGITNSNRSGPVISASASSRERRGSMLALSPRVSVLCHCCWCLGESESGVELWKTQPALLHHQPFYVHLLPPNTAHCLYSYTRSVTQHYTVPHSCTNEHVMIVVGAEDFLQTSKVSYKEWTRDRNLDSGSYLIEVGHSRLPP